MTVEGQQCEILGLKSDLTNCKPDQTFEDYPAGYKGNFNFMARKMITNETMKDALLPVQLGSILLPCA